MKRRAAKAGIPSSRWTTYAVAGLATTAGGAIPASAEIHYSGRVDKQLENDDTLFPLSGGASLLFQRESTFGANYDYMWIVQAQHEGVATNNSSSSSSSHSFLKALKFHRGINVSTAGFFQAFGQLCSISGNGNFLARAQGMAVFMFDTGKGAQYGWARIRTTVGGPYNQMEVIDYAWADPGEPILTGQKKTGVLPEADAPESGSLGLLAQGSRGLLAWRKSRAENPAPPGVR